MNSIRLQIKGLNNIKYTDINKVMIYFCIISMSLFLGTDRFPFVEIPLIFVCLYTIFYSIKIKCENVRIIFKTSFYIWFILIFGLLIITTILYTNSQLITLLKNTIVFCIYIFCMALLYVDKKNEQKIDLFRIAEITALICCCWILVFEYKQLLEGKRIGFSIMLSNPNGAGTILSLYLFCIMYRINENRKIKDIVVMVLCVAIIFATGSKHAILIMAVGSLIFLFKNGKLIFNRVLIFIVAFAITGVLIFKVPILYKNVGQRFLKLLGAMDVIEYNTDSSSELRIKYFNKAIELWQEKPILGGGYDCFSLNSGYNTYSHTNYTELLVSIGIIGLIIYYSYYIYLIINIIKKYIKERDNKKVLAILILIAIILSDIGAVTFTLYPLYYFILLIISNRYSNSLKYKNKFKGR